MWGKKAPYNVGGVGKCVGVKIARVKSRGFSCGVFSCVGVCLRVVDSSVGGASVKHLQIARVCVALGGYGGRHAC